MRKRLRPTMRKESRWKITRIRGNRAELVGTVAAADEKAAIKAAIKDYHITNPEQQRRLAARLDE
jgi:hypothetical protein